MMSSLYLVSFPFLAILISLTNAGPANKIEWVPYQNALKNLSSLIPGGKDLEKDQYIVKVKVGDSFFPAKLIQGRNDLWNIYYGNNGEEIAVHGKQIDKQKPEFLSFPAGTLHWVYAEGSRVPKDDMIPGGYDSKTKETIFICRAYLSKSSHDTVVTGKYMDSVGECEYPFDLKESKSRIHEVLALSPYGRAIGATIPKLNLKL